MWRREEVVWAMLVLVLVLLLIPLVFMKWGFLDLSERREELAERQAENQAIAQENRVLEVEIRRLKKDPAYLEHVARTELGMVAEDEIVVKFHGKDSAE